ncbi:hypothetical protein NQD34_015966 [Periophthalmus magnuspinnatus]|nr:hypothetical protein NQD34_015966 [Periophthalmus magnuspinnatus]
MLKVHCATFLVEDPPPTCLHGDAITLPGMFLGMDFSSAFSSIQRHLMIQKLQQLNISTRLIHLIYNFLSNRQQVVRLGLTTSSALIINTGARQGCVLSPFLYTLYTNDNTSSQRLSVIIKLKGLYVSPHLLLLLYKSIIQPILLYCSTCFYNMLTVKNRTKLIKVTHIPAKIIGLPTPNLTDLNNRAIGRFALATGLHSPPPGPSNPSALMTEIQGDQVQEGTVRQKPDPSSHCLFKQQAR